MKQHPDPATLVTCSAGSQPEALCAVVSSHISMCPECLRELLQMEQIGAALFDGLGPTAMDKTCASGAAKTVDHSNHRHQGKSEVPDPVRELIGSDLNKLEWTRLWDGVDQYQVQLSPDGRGDLRLIRLGAGYSLPEHGHKGEELTIVLRGAYRDGSALFNIGDFSDLDDETRHAITATDDGECIILIASETTPEFLNGPAPTCN